MINASGKSSVIYNNKEKLAIVYNGNGRYAKAYSLSLTVGSNTSMTVNRTSSIYKNATLGLLSSGASIYYGDVLVISATANSGYNLTTFTVNGVSWTSGESLTVLGVVSVVTEATAYLPSWKTVWTGNVNHSVKKGSTNFNWATTLPVSDGTLVRVTGEFRFGLPNYYDNANFTATLPTSANLKYAATKSTTTLEFLSSTQGKFTSSGSYYDGTVFIRQIECYY